MGGSHLNGFDAPDGASWAVMWVAGEMSNPITFMRVSEAMARVRDAETAKVFQGTDNGAPAIYIVFKQ